MSITSYALWLLACSRHDADRDGWPQESDCDDRDPDVHPGATDEYGDGTDSDCDGTDLGPAQGLGQAAAALFGAYQSNAGFGLASGDVNDDGQPDLIVGAPNYDASGDAPAYAGRVYSVWGPIDGGSASALSGSDAILTSDGEWAGQNIACGNVDGTAGDDIIVGYPWESSDHPKGVVYLFYNIQGDVPLDRAHASNSILGDVTEAEGSSVVAGEDLNGDGVDDLVTGLRAWNGAAGEVSIHFGPILESRYTSDADVRLVSSAPGDEAGTALDHAGDVNGDGTLDLIVGAQMFDAHRGAAYIAYGPFSAGLGSSAIVGDTQGDQAGFAVSGMGDTNNDGFADVAIGAPGVVPSYTNGRGALYALDGPIVGKIELGDSAVVMEGEQAGDTLGTSIADGVLDCDGPAAVVVGAPALRSSDYSGRAYVLDSTGVAQVLVGQDSGDAAGMTLLAGVDLNGDSCNDLLVGAPYADMGGFSSGTVYLLSGRTQ